MRREESNNRPEDIIQEFSKEDLDEIIQRDYLVKRDDRIDFTSKGEFKATHLIRSHRLAERLFADVLDLPTQSLETNACKFEHILSSEVQDAICTLLGHPKECPHGRLIPPGQCCAGDTREVKSIIIPLTELKAGERGKIIYIATKHHSRLDQLTALGVTPGAEIVVHQTAPSYIIRSAQTDIAIDEDVAKDISIRKTLQ